MFEEFIGKIAEYTNNFSVLGIVKLSVDAVLSLLILFFIVKLFKAKTHNKWLYVIMVGIIIAVIAIYILQMQLLLTIVKFLAFWSLGVLLIIYSTEVRRFFENNFHNARISTPQVTEAEKKEAEGKFKEINHAYEVLSDPDKKANYDKLDKQGKFHEWVQEMIVWVIPPMITPGGE